MTDRYIETKANEIPKQIVREAFEKTQQIINELGWTGKALEKNGALRSFVNPQTGEISGNYIDDYPIKLTKFIEETGLSDPNTIAFLNLAVIWSIAQRDYKDNPSAFSGEVRKLEGDPKFRLALMLVENPNRGRIFEDIISTNGFPFEQKLHNGEVERTNPNLPYFTADEVREAWLKAPLPERRDKFSSWEVIKLIKQAN